MEIDILRNEASRHNNLREIAESTFDQLVGIHGLGDTIGKIQVTYRSAIKYFLRLIFDDDHKVRKYAPTTRQLSYINTALSGLSKEEQSKVLRLLCQMEKERCEQAVSETINECDIKREQIDFTGSIRRADIWPTDLDIVIHHSNGSKANIGKFRQLLADRLGKKVDIKIV